MTTRQDREEKKKNEPGKQQQHDPHERTVAPPIEREHETRQGIEQEDEQRKRERERR